MLNEPRNILQHQAGGPLLPDFTVDLQKERISEARRKGESSPRTRSTTIEAHLVPQKKVVGILHLLGFNEATDGAVGVQRRSARGVTSAETSETHHQVSIPFAADQGSPFFLTWFCMFLPV